VCGDWSFLLDLILSSSSFTLFRPEPKRKLSKKEARAEFVGAVRDFILNPPYDSTAVFARILEHYASHSLPVSSLLQENASGFEGRSAVYWAVAKLGNHAPAGAQAAARAVLAAAAPLSFASVQAVRAAALVSGDSSTWAAARTYAVPTVFEHAVLLGPREDTAMVVGATPGGNAVMVDVSLPLFRQRMKVGGPVGVDFLAKGASPCAPLSTS
jgi:hypothetical protein